MKVFCFPYAGGSSMAYSTWNRFANDIEIVPVELPGRGRRFEEELCDNIKDIVDKLYNELKEEFISEEYMLLGHSMGSIIVFYLADKIVQEGIRQPSSLFFSGRQAPDIAKEEIISYKMNDEEFIEGIYKLGGTPEELLQSKELLDIFTPILKNDYKLVETCKYDREISAFDCDIVIFNGEDDNLTDEDINAWNKFTKGKFEVYNFEGGHFFINNHYKEIIKIIENKSKQILYV